MEGDSNFCFFNRDTMGGSSRKGKKRRADDSDSDTSDSDNHRRSSRSRRDADDASRKKKSSRDVTEEEITQYLSKKAQKKVSTCFYIPYFMIWFGFMFRIFIHLFFIYVQAMKVAKKIKTTTVAGYSNDSNPFGDSNLNEK